MATYGKPPCWVGDGPEDSGDNAGDQVGDPIHEPDKAEAAAPDFIVEELGGVRTLSNLDERGRCANHDEQRDEDRNVRS